MAGLKKKRPEKSGSPNTVLVIFLVFFFLLSIGLGIWGYYGYAGQDALVKDKRAAEAKAKGAETGLRFYRMQYRYFRTALGDKLDEKETGQLMNDDLPELKKPDAGIFNAEPDKDASQILNTNLRKLLQTPEGEDTFKKDFPTMIKELDDRAKAAEAKAAQSLTKAERMEDLAKRLIAKQDKFHQDSLAEIGKESAGILLAVKEKSAETKKLIENNADFVQKLKEKDDELFKKEEDHANAIKALNREIARLKVERKDAEAAGGGALVPGRGDATPNLLDISMGKPLWDLPVGKITRVDLDVRQVNINLGHSHGVKPELTFNIFGANSSGRAYGQLKGSIEIIKVIDASNSTARITSLYDSEGREVLLNQKTQGRTLRETEAPLREGDLLFNMFWGTRVAVVGYVSITGDASDIPADQYRQMEDFMYLLRRQGMQVDAFVDMRDGKIQGAVTAKTRYLIRGDDLRTEAKPAPKMGDDDKEKDKDKDAGKEALNLDRNDTINKASRSLYGDAKERGLLVISAENFATVIGYRRARSATSTEVSSFRPGLPFAGEANTGVIRDRPAPPPAEEKKEMEKKDGN